MKRATKIPGKRRIQTEEGGETNTSKRGGLKKVPMRRDKDPNGGRQTETKMPRELAMPKTCRGTTNRCGGALGQG